MARPQGPASRGDESPAPKPYRMPYGRYKGLPVMDCPRDYLTWLLRDGPPLTGRLRQEVEMTLEPDAGCLGPAWWRLGQTLTRGG
jgi:uncharacterized protein (DUF3820 family)